jgi:hypothetical protein
MNKGNLHRMLLDEWTRELEAARAGTEEEGADDDYFWDEGWDCEDDDWRYYDTYSDDWREEDLSGYIEELDWCEDDYAPAPTQRQRTKQEHYNAIWNECGY